MKTFFGVCLRGAVPLLAFLALVCGAHASRWFFPMGHYISEAELIVITDTEKAPTQPGFGRGETALLIREVLKGDGTLAGQRITFRRSRWSTADAYVPADAKNIAVLLRAGWKESKEWPVLEAYQKPQEIEALRMLVPICAIKNERERLLALRATLASKNHVCEEEIFAQLKEIQSPSNFDILTNLYNGAELTNQLKLVQLIGEIGDVRGVPTLIEAAASSDRKLSAAAVWKLSLNFPGAPGVTAAMERALKKKHLAQEAARYLEKRSPNPELKQIAHPKTTWFLRAQDFLARGQTNEAMALYLETLKDKREQFRTRLNAASLAIKAASLKEKDEIRQMLLPLIAGEDYANDYIISHKVAQILRELHHPDCLLALSSILQSTPFTSGEATWTASLAIRELGEESRQKAVAEIMTRLKSPPPKTVMGSNPDRYPLELLWIGNGGDFKAAEPLMDPTYNSSWKSLRPLQAMNDARDEAAFLVETLSQQTRLPEEAIEWMLLRLADLKEERAIPILARSLVDELDWRVDQRAADALVAIGGRSVEEELTRLLSHPGGNRVRRHATEAIIKVEGQRSLDLCRQILIEKDLGWKPAAYEEIGRAGTTNDLPLAFRLADFWTGDRTNHYWAMQALGSLRSRYNYDITGPVKIVP